MGSTDRGEVTRLLVAWRNGDSQAAEDLMPLIYDELHKIAAGYLSREKQNHTLQATALVNEAYLRLVEQRVVDWSSRTHFFAIAARLIHRILVDHARRHRYAKRGGGKPDLPLSEVVDLAIERPELLVDLDEALTSLDAVDPFKARIVEYRFFGGLTTDEAAEVIGCSPATVTRHWRMAKAWLYRELASHGGEHG